MSYVCISCSRRVFVTRTDYLSDGRCHDCGGTIIAGGDGQ